MARRPAIRSIARGILLITAIFGSLAGIAPHRAAAQPTDARTSGPDPAQPLPVSRSVALDEYPPPSAQRYLIIGGLASTAVWYGAALGTSYAVDDPAVAKDLRIPVAGPWMALGHSGCYGGSCSKVLIVFGAIAATLDGLGQAAGLALAAEGLFMPTQEPKRAHAALEHKGFAWQPTFDAGKNSVSFGVLGVF